jgi:hypothetical protein
VKPHNGHSPPVRPPDSASIFLQMGVPAFFRWLQLKYPKTLVAVVEEDSIECEGGQIPGQNVDFTGPNPNHIEFDCLYVDMNGFVTLVTAVCPLLSLQVRRWLVICFVLALM